MNAIFTHNLRLWDFRNILETFTNNSLVFACEKKEKTSQYKGVYWHKESGKWYVIMHLKGRKQSYGGCFKDELDAAKRVNQLCDELRIPLQNPEISAIPNQQYQVTIRNAFSFIQNYENLFFHFFFSKKHFFLFQIRTFLQFWLQ